MQKDRRKLMRIDVNTAKQSIKDYSYALLYMLSEVILAKVEEIGDIDWSECLEARFFNEKGELRIWRENDKWGASVCADEGEYIESEYALDGRFSNRWKKLSVRQYIDYDRDGQVYISSTTLSGLGRDE